MVQEPDHDATEVEIAAAAVRPIEADQQVRKQVEAGLIAGKHEELAIQTVQN